MEHIHGKSSNVFSNLSSGTTYYVKTRVNDIAGNGLTESAATTAITQSLGTCSISVTDDGKWTISKTATITKTGNGTLQYRIVSGTTEKVGWTNYSSATTINWAANATTPTDIYCRVTDGTNIKDGATKSITKVDTTAPTSVSFTTSTTTNSIKVTASATDNESGIAKYQFSSDGGTTWTGVQDSNIYTFSNIKTGSYNIKVRAYNGTYGTGGRLYKDSASTSTKTEEIGTCSIKVASNGLWTTSKSVTIEKGGNGTLQYRVVSGTTEKVGWTNYTSAITINWNATKETPTTVYCRVTDGTNTLNPAPTATITTVDTTSPTEASFTYTKSTNSIKVVASGTDAESGISTYWFSKDGGKSWTAAQTSNTYTFSGLTSGTYPIMVSVGNGTYPNGGTSSYKNSAATNVTLDSLGTCSVGSGSPNGWSTSKSVGITKTGNGTLQYKVGNGAWTNYTNALTINWNATAANPVSVSCRVTDGVNVNSGNTVSVATVDTTAPTSASFTTSSATNSIKSSGKWNR